MASTLSDVIEELPDLIKVLQDGAAVAKAIDTKDFAAVVMGFPSYEADVVKLVNDIKALGVTQAVAAGTVVTT